MLKTQVVVKFVALSCFLSFSRVSAVNHPNFGSATIRRVVDSRLDDVIATTFETTSFTQCIVHCLDNTQCMSVNWSPLTITDARETRTCELMTSRVADDDELQSAIGWQHFCKHLYSALSWNEFEEGMGAKSLTVVKKMILEFPNLRDEEGGGILTTSPGQEPIFCL